MRAGVQDIKNRIGSEFRNESCLDITCGLFSPICEYGSMKRGTLKSFENIKVGRNTFLILDKLCV